MTVGEEGNRTAGGEGGEVPISKLRNNKLQSLGPKWSMSEVGTPPLHNLDKPHVLVASNNNNNNKRNKGHMGGAFIWGKQTYHQM